MDRRGPRKTNLGLDYAEGLMDATQVHTATKRLDERINGIEKLMNTQLDRARTPAVNWSDFYANLERDAAELGVAAPRWRTSAGRLGRHEHVAPVIDRSYRGLEGASTGRPLRPRTRHDQVGVMEPEPRKEQCEVPLAR